MQLWHEKREWAISKGRRAVCASTYNTRVCILREIFHVLAQKAGLEEDPWEGVRLRPDDFHSRRELTMEELKRLLEAAKNAGCEGNWREVSDTNAANLRR